MNVGRYPPCNRQGIILRRVLSVEGCKKSGDGMSIGPPEVFRIWVGLFIFRELGEMSSKLIVFGIKEALP